MKPYNSRSFEQIVVFLFLFLLPTQLGKHFFPAFSYVDGVKIDYLSPAIYITDILVCMLIAINRKQLMQKIKSFRFSFVFVLLVLILHAFTSPLPLFSLYGVFKIIELVLVFFVAKKIINQKLILIAFLLGGIVELSLALMQLYTHASLQGFFYFLGERYLTISHPGIATTSLFGKLFLRPYGTFSHPNSLAGFYLLLYFYILTHHPFRRSFILYTISSFVFTSLIFISFSKIAILIYLVLNALYAIRYMKIECIICVIGRVITLIILSVIFLSSQADPLSLEKRMTLFLNGVALLKSHFLWGVGLGHYIIYQAQFSSPYRYFFLQPVHNIFILFFTQTGIVIGILLIIPLWKSLKHQWQKPSFFFCFLAVVMTGMFDHYWLTLQQNWLLMGVIFGFLEYANQTT